MLIRTRIPVLVALLLTGPVAFAERDAAPAEAPPATLEIESHAIGTLSERVAVGQLRSDSEASVRLRMGSAKIRTLRVTNENGVVRVFVDDDEVPQDQLRERGGTLHWVTDHGEEVPAFFDHPVMADAVGIFRTPAVQPIIKQPTVMIGIHHALPGPALERHLGLSANSATLITGVCRGLSAERAGVSEYDVVIAIAGDAPADPPRLLKAIAETTPGHVLQLTLIREGAEREVEVEVEPFDADRFMAAEVIGERMNDAFDLFGNFGYWGRTGDSGHFGDSMGAMFDTVFVAPGGLRFLSHENVHLPMLDLSGDVENVWKQVRDKLGRGANWFDHEGQADGSLSIGVKLDGAGQQIVDSAVWQTEPESTQSLMRRIAELERRLRELESRLPPASTTGRE